MSGGGCQRRQAGDRLHVISAASAWRGDHTSLDSDVSASRETFSQEIQIAPAFVLLANETQQFEASVQVPGNLQPSFQGNFTNHEWKIRGRLDAFGNDPDSGYAPLRIGLKS